MDKVSDESEFLKLLRLNDKEKLKKYIFENGKEGKAFCPISFDIDRGENDDEENRK